MKFKSAIWKSRKVNVRDHIGIEFDSKGNCEINVKDEAEAKFLCANILGLSISDDDGDENAMIGLGPVKEKVIDGTIPSINEDEIKKNQDELSKSIQLTEEEIAKKEAINKINDIKKLSTLKKLAKEFNEEEWKDLTTEDQFKKYLISKI